MTAEWPPTGITLRSWSAYLLQEYPLDEAVPAPAMAPGTLKFEEIEPPPGYDPATDPLQPMIAVVLPVLSKLTCRNFTTGEDIPDDLVPVATLAVVLAVEQLVYSTSAAARAAALSTSDNGNLRSISAGPWSESYFAPGEGKYAWNQIVPDPLLNSMLMALITPECLAVRMGAAEGEFPPGYATQEVDWNWPPGYGSPRTNFPETGGDWLP